MIIFVPPMRDSCERTGLVHVYTGSGKGKTTAALGTALRAAGWNMRVCVIQFIKGYSDTGEARFAREHPNILALKQFAIDLSRDIDAQKIERRQSEVEAAMTYAEEAVSSGDYDLVILDEINNAIHRGLVDVSRVLSLIQAKPSELEFILTGRDADQKIIDAADYVTDMRLVKHPYQHGAQARRGVDY
ncbi:MAG: cob(I)yrinic acid a,c-diamide adenosyltransferase [Armatimonadota bacterium]|nr:cob(I)yrinic acid a,c-diamide adenosyltransferase [bacterium]